MSTTPAWRRHAGELAWPTLLLALAVCAGHAAATWAAASGHLGLGAAFAINTLAAYLAFTPAHEAAHGNIHGRHARLGFLDPLVGWLSAVLLAAPFSAFRVIHLAHHSHTNDPQRDPDYWVAGKSAIGVAARCLTIVPHYYAHFLFGATSRTQGAGSARASTIAGLVLVLGGAALAVATGHGGAVLALWLGPALLASGLLAFGFDWLPHVPHRERGRYRDTRALLFPGLGLLLVGQNLHLVHHLYPRVPFYRYAACFRALRPELEAEGALVVDLAAGPSREARRA